jgi:RNA polymerase sigma-70 factor, ECF subfamily
MATAAVLDRLNTASVTALTEHAFGEFYREHSRPLWTYVYRVTGNAADADDIVQEAFCRLLRADVPELTEDALRPYVFRIAGNLITDRWRRSNREQPGLSHARNAAAAPTSPSFHDHDVTRTFAALKPRERALLWLAYVEGEDHKQIAESLGLARGSIKVLLSRARARLRDRLEAKGLIGKR